MKIDMSEDRRAFNVKLRPDTGVFTQVILGRTGFFYHNFVKERGRPAYYTIDWGLGLGVIEFRHFMTPTKSQIETWLANERDESI